MLSQMRGALASQVLPNWWGVVCKASDAATSAGCYRTCVRIDITTVAAELW